MRLLLTSWRTEPSLVLVAALLLGVLGTAAAPRAQGGGNVTVVNGQVWDGNGGPFLSGGVYHVDGNAGSCGVSVPVGQTLTIQPGAIVKIDGCFLVSGTLNAVGTPQSGIVFTSIHDDAAGGDTNGNGAMTVPQPGDWGHIEVFGTARFDYCDLFYGGRVSGSVSGCLKLRDRPVTLDHCVVAHSASNGAFEAANLAASDCTFRDLAGIPIVGLAWTSIPGLVDNVALRCAGGDYTLVTLGGVLTTDMTLDPRYSMNGSGVFVFGVVRFVPQVAAGATLTLPGNTVVKFEGRAFDRLVSFGAIDAVGAAGSPVVLTSIDDDSVGGDTRKDGNATTPQPGDWAGVQFQGGDRSQLFFLDVRYAGSGGQALEINQSRADFFGCRVADSAGHGIRFRSKAAAPTSRMQFCSFENNAARPVFEISFEELAASYGNTASGNGGGDHVHVLPERLDRLVRIDPGNFPGDVIEVGSRILFQVGGVLELGAGTIVKWSGGAASGTSGGLLRCFGTARRPVVFTAFEDDAFGGDTNGDGGATTPTPGAWGQLFLSSPHGDTFENTVVRYAGRSGAAAVQCTDTGCQVRSLRVEHSAVAGARFDAAARELVNVVVRDCAGPGLVLNNGTFDVVHATSTRNAGDGIVRTGNWTGNVVNSISWGNTGVGFGSLTANDVRFSNGGFAGSNGNIDADPRFTNAGAGDLSLLPGSPSIDTAEVAPARLVVKDHAETSRLQDLGLGGNPLPDMGAFEAAPYALRVTGTPALGSGLSFTLEGVPGSIGTVFVGVPQGLGTWYPGVGYFMAGFPAFVVPAAPVPMGQPVPLALPGAVSLLGAGFHVQGLGILPGPGLQAGFTNLERVTLLWP